MIDIKDVESVEFQGYQAEIKEILELSFKYVKEYLLDENSNREKKFKLACDLLKKQNIKVDLGNASGNLKLRFKIFRRDDFSCVYCGRNPEQGALLQIDHVNPRSNNGKDTEDNLVTACFDCNSGKKDFLLNERQEERFRKSVNNVGNTNA